MSGFENLLTLVASLSWLVQHPFTHTVVVTYLAGILLWASVFKLTHPWYAAISAANLGVVRRPSRSVGYLIGVLEAMIAAAILWPGFRRTGLLIAAAIFVVFSVLLALALRHSPEAPCYCLGSSDRSISHFSVARACALSAVALLAWAHMPLGITMSRLEAVMGHWVGLQVLVAPLIVYRLGQVKASGKEAFEMISEPVT